MHDNVVSWPRLRLSLLSKKALDANWYSIIDADIKYLPQNELTLSDEDFEAFEKLYEAVEDDEDVDSIYHNVG